MAVFESLQNNIHAMRVFHTDRVLSDVKIFACKENLCAPNLAMTRHQYPNFYGLGKIGGISKNNG
jgi:hypothetical protein